MLPRVAVSIRHCLLLQCQHQLVESARSHSLQGFSGHSKQHNVTELDRSHLDRKILSQGLPGYLTHQENYSRPYKPVFYRRHLRHQRRRCVQGASATIQLSRLSWPRLLGSEEACYFRWSAPLSRSRRINSLRLPFSSSRARLVPDIKGVLGNPAHLSLMSEPLSIKSGTILLVFS